MNPILASVQAQLPRLDAPFTMLIPLRIRPDALGAFRKEAAIAAAASLAEPGCVAYEFHAAVGDPQRFVLWERWRSFADLEAHFGLPHTARILAVLEDVGEDAEPMTIWQPLPS